MKKLLIISSLLAFMAISNSLSAQSFKADIDNTTDCDIQITFRDGGGAILFQYTAVPGITAVGCTSGTVNSLDFVAAPCNTVTFTSAGGTISFINSTYCPLGPCCPGGACTFLDNITVTPNPTLSCGPGTNISFTITLF